jgi:hypothetical protein
LQGICCQDPKREEYKITNLSFCKYNEIEDVEEWIINGGKLTEYNTFSDSNYFFFLTVSIVIVESSLLKP